MRWLTAEPQGAPGLMLAHWWVESWSRRLGLLPAHWWVKPGPGVRVSLLVGRASSWSPVVRLRGRRAGVGSLVVGGSS